MFGGGRGDNNEFEDDEFEGEEMGGIAWPMEGIIEGSHFSEVYQVASTTSLPAAIRPTVEYGNKIVMPASALDTLSRLNIMYPMMFCVRSETTGHSTFCGVLEFSAPEGTVYLSSWLLRTLKIRAGDLVELSNVALPRGTFIRIQPQSVDFLDITDPRAVLEHSLRNFATLTIGDRIAIRYNDRTYELLVEEVRPSTAGRQNVPRSSPVGISVVETDLQVDFSPPPGYQEPTSVAPNRAREEKSLAKSVELSSSAASSSIGGSVGGGIAFAPFKGTSNRLSTRPKTIDTDEATASTKPLSPDGSTSGSTTTTSLANKMPAPLNLPKKTLYFGGSSSTTNTNSKTGAAPAKTKPDAPKESQWKVFSGQPNRL